MKTWQVTAWCWLMAGCAGQPLPDPDVALKEYQQAVARRDAAAVHAMLDADARAALSVQDVKRLLEGTGPQLDERAKALSATSARVDTTAEVTYSDGEVSVLNLEDGRFRVTGAGGLPGWGATPAQALGELRRALQRRSYSAMSAVLSSDSRRDLEQELKGLIDGLSRPEALDIDVDGDRAVVTTPSGHVVQLRREDGVWKVRDFD